MKQFPDLRTLIDKGESETLEFKESFDKEAIRTSTAFANARGGTILIGVSDKGKIKGTSIGKESLQKWANRISQSTEPSIIPQIEVKKTKEKSLVLIRIKEFPIKPVSMKGRCFKRVGNSNRKMSPQEIAKMHLDSRGTSWDALPAREASIEDIDLEEVEKYIRKANTAGRRSIEEDEEPMRVLEKLELIKNRVPTWSAILLFGEEPQSLLPQAQIHCGRFREETKVIDDQMIEGTIIKQVNDALDFIRKNINVEFVRTGKPGRKEMWDYPLEALREAIINAVCHRDYSAPSNIEIRIYDDRLNVWSPGGLPSGITLEDLYKPHQSVLRNMKIAGVFYDIGWIEQWGSGIEIMRKACTDAELPEPALEENQGLQVIFRKDILTRAYLQECGFNERQIKAVMQVKEIGSIRLSDLKSLAPEVSDKTLYRDLQDLVKEGVLKAVGKKKGRRYELA